MRTAKKLLGWIVGIVLWPFVWLLDKLFPDV